ncbi:hypothetical protein K439DRAFT_377992 [Ramaria rubella]|nr:hypothetical protein K439DRAFT_377992 [Ramaria rubella]
MEGSWSPSCEVSLRETLPAVLPIRDEFPEDSEDWDLWHRELCVWLRLQEALLTEVKIYRRLRDLQGISIPVFYGLVELEIREDQQAPPLIRFVQGLALEHIDGLQLDDLEQLHLSSDDSERLSQAALAIVRTMRKREVLHEDVRSANVIVRTSDMSPCLIDFGVARVCENETEEEWSDAVSDAAAIMSMRLLLRRHGLHDPTPSGGHTPHPLRGYITNNGDIEWEGHTQAWRDKYWESVEVVGPTFKIVKDDEGKEHVYEFSRWRPKGTHVTSNDY